MRLVKAIKNGFSGFFDIKGRANRSDFLWWILFYLVMLYVGTIIDGEYINPLLDYLPGEDGAPDWATNIIFYVMLIPTITMAIRRAHDSGKKGWWILSLFPVFKKGDKRENDFGPKP